MNRTSLIRKPAPTKPVEYTPDPKYTEYRDLMSIDRARLDVMIERQSNLFMEVGEYFVAAREAYDAAKDELTRHDSQCAADFRKANAGGATKVTVDMVTDAVLLNPQHIKLTENLRRLKRHMDDWGNLRDAYDSRMRALKELVSLYIAGYHSDASTISAGNRVRDAQAATARERLNESRLARTRGE